MDIRPSARLTRVIAASALALAGLVMVGAEPGPASAVPCQSTFTSTAPGAITAGLWIASPYLGVWPGSGTSTAEVPDGIIADVDVTVQITAPSADAVRLVVEHAGVTSLLKNTGGSTGRDFTGTTFDDEATNAITDAAPPYAGRFHPVSVLSSFDGLTAGGTWTLTASNFSLAPGVIDSWAVAVTYAVCDYDGDAVEDHSDACLGLPGATASGCPPASRALTAKYRRGRFKGALSSSAAACNGPQSVTIWKVRPGPDRKIGTRTTASDGTYKLRRARHAGTYYATSPRVVVSSVAECPATTSPRLRLR